VSGGYSERVVGIRRVEGAVGAGSRAAASRDHLRPPPARHRGLTASVAVLLAACPILASGYVLARQRVGDPALLAGLITLTTIATALTMRLVLARLTCAGADRRRRHSTA
jgi:hypothetical protein